MPDEVVVNCISCQAEIPKTEVVRPIYKVLSRPGREIQPLPRCGPCRTAYEKEKTGLRKVQP